MKQFFIAGLFLLLALNAFGQNENINVVKSSIFKDKKKHSSLAFSEDDGNGGVVTLRTYYGGFIPKLKGYYIEHFDKNLNLIKETELEVDKNYIKGILIDEGVVKLIEYNHNKKADKYEFNILSASLKDLDFKREELFALGEEEIKKYFGVVLGLFFINNGMNQMDSNALGDVSFSQNKNFIAFNFDIKNKDEETHRIFVYNRKFERVNEYEFKKDIKDRLFDYENVDVDDNDGSVYLLGKVFENKSRSTKKKGKANYHYELYKLNDEGQIKVSFRADDNFVGSLTTIRSNNKLSCVGFYGEKKDWRYKGVCRFDMNPETLEIEKKNFNAFSEQFILDKYGKKKEKELRNISYRGIFVQENGAIIMNAEEFFVTTHTYSSPNGGFNTRTIFHYNDIISTKMDANGKLVWARNINKAQTGTTFSSYTSTIDGDNVHFFINCSDKIKKLRNDRILFKQTKAKKSNLYAITIDGNGDFDYRSIVDDKDSEVTFFVNNGILSNEGKDIIFMGRKKKKKQLIKVSL